MGLRWPQEAACMMMRVHSRYLGLLLMANSNITQYTASEPATLKHRSNACVSGLNITMALLKKAEKLVLHHLLLFL